MQRNKKFRMIDPDSYPVDIDPYQEIDTMQPPNFLNQLHDWFSNISSKMKQSLFKQNYCYFITIN